MLAFDLFPDQEGKYSFDELKTALDTCFADVMSGKYFNPDCVLPGDKAKIVIVKSYSVEIVKDKNSIFDISDLVIKRLKDMGFDAGSPKEGKIPETIMSKNFIFCKICGQINLCQALFCGQIIFNGRFAKQPVRFRKYPILHRLRKIGLSDWTHHFPVFSFPLLPENEQPGAGNGQTGADQGGKEYQDFAG